jgi:hypothetical protein
MVEVWDYEKPVATGFTALGKGGNNNAVYRAFNDEELKNKRKRNDLESYHRFKRLVMLNFGKRAKFLTLTFADTKKFSIKSVADCNKEFKKFIQRLRRKFGGDFKYLAVVEFQKPRNAVHYHLVLDLPFIKSSEYEKAWGLGFIKIQKVGGSEKAAAYLSKYLKKSFTDSRMRNKKKYWGSKNLLEPKEFCNEEVSAIEEAIDFESVYNSAYYSEYHDMNINYAVYYL